MNAASQSHGDPREGSLDQLVIGLLARAGVTVGGPAPHDIQVHDRRFYERVLRDGRLAMGETYMDGWWDSPNLDQTVTKLLLANLDAEVRKSWKLKAHFIKAKLVNLQSVTRAFEVGERHYDISNALYQAMLGRSMAYTCGYWKDATDLDSAQDAKHDLVCRKLGLQPGMRVLELGCGWGAFAHYAAKHYGVHITGLTVSKEQVALGMKRCEGLPVQLKLEDYRNATGSYDRVVSVGIMEHVGVKNYRTYMEVANRCLAPGGLAFVHTIGGNVNRSAIDPWFHRYIFPNAVLPTLAQLSEATEGLFVIEDVQNIGPDYDPTLMAWYHNATAAWDTLPTSYDQRFKRMWDYYLLTSAAGFRARTTQLYQLVLTKIGTPQPDCRMS